MKEQLSIEWRFHLMIATLASVLLALLGPFGTYQNFSLGARLLYWGGMVFLVLLPAVFVHEALVHRLSGSVTRRDAIIAVIKTVIFAPLIWAFNAFVMEFDVLSLLGFAEHLAIALLIFQAAVAIRSYHQPASQGTPRRAVSRPSRPAPAFMQRLEPPLAGPILRASADGHQTTIYTAEGAAQIRMRFSDVLEALQGQDGVRIHRSHWVAFAAITDIWPEGRRYAAMLGCGTVLPVSTTGAEELRGVGILAE